MKIGFLKNVKEKEGLIRFYRLFSNFAAQTKLTKVAMNKEGAAVTEESQVIADSNKLNFKKLNNIGGWVVFAISALVYLLTLEPTASFWDCGEFIACSYKLQVPHPPGAPFFLLVGRMFSLLALGNLELVAYWINVSSALCSAFTILFLFWSITLFGRKLLPERRLTHLSDGQIITLLGAGLIGSLAYTFSDSFWFSAVEAEVYAMSSFFTAFVVWAMLKWEIIDDEDQVLANRWLILIAYMMGLSIGVHLLNLVTIPALGLIYYYKKYEEPNLIGVLATMALSGVIIIAILEGIIPGLPSLAGAFEIIFVNSFGLPFGSGAIFVSLVILGGLVYGIIYSIQKRKVLLNTALLSLAFILIGYASYGIILIRSQYNPPINENDPSDIIKYISYLKREQYGDRPLMYGPTFNSPVKRTPRGAPVRVSKGKLYRVDKEKGKYVVYDERFGYEYEDNMLLPRIYSRQDNHAQLYIQKIYGDRRVDPNRLKLTMADNLTFLFKYQFGEMYWRYFFWNFAGRESDIEGAGYLLPWSSDNDVPKNIAENKGRNQFYMLPLILGILGLVFTAQRSQQTFFITMMLFFLTGLALVLYLNSPPVEPRERDYIYAGSYYAFAMWIGFGVIFLTDLLLQFIKNYRTAALIATGVCLVVPGIMAAEGWDDHDRSNRYHSVDSARNLLESCAPNAILFTGGDNDTFPLWYVQEVEGFRTDVRVCNLSLLGTDWYIDQMKRKAYESEALPISLEKNQYIQGTNDQILYAKAWQITPSLLSAKEIDALSKKGMYLKTYIDLVKAGDKRVKAQSPGDNEELTIIPTQRLVLKIDKEDVLKKGIVPKDKESLIKDQMVWNLTSNSLFKNDLIILDMIANNNWERPIYFSTTLSPRSYMNLKEYMQREGLAFRLMPFKVPGATQGFVNSDIMYENMMNKFHWRELDNPSVYYNENYLRFTLNLRDSFYRLAIQLLNEGKEEKAKKAIDAALKRMPEEVIPFDAYSVQLIDALFRLKDEKQALEIAKTMGDQADETLDYYIFQSDNPRGAVAREQIQLNLYILRQIVDVLNRYEKTEEVKPYQQMFDKYIQRAPR